MLRHLVKRMKQKAPKSLNVQVSAVWAPMAMKLWVSLTPFNLAVLRAWSRVYISKSTHLNLFFCVQQENPQLLELCRAQVEKPPVAHRRRGSDEWTYLPYPNSHIAADAIRIFPDNIPFLDPLTQCVLNGVRPTIQAILKMSTHGSILKRWLNVFHHKTVISSNVTASAHSPLSWTTVNASTRCLLIMTATGTALLSATCRVDQVRKQLALNVLILLPRWLALCGADLHAVWWFPA